MSKQEAHPSFYCPITQEIMRDPVVDRDGNSYEREAIMGWLERQSVSPITRNPLHARDLVPNRSLRSSIEDYLNSSVRCVEGQPAAAAQSERTVPEPAAEGPVAAFAAPALSLLRGPSSADGAEHSYLVSVKAEEPASLQRHPATIVCVVDTSGSMCSEAAVQGVESTGLSMLDIVKHAVRTVLTTLNDHDRFGLVTFSTRGRVCFELMYMTPAGKALALSKVADLKTGGSTNLWEGLKLGMDMLAATGDTAGNSALFLLTDGVPSEVPPRGHIAMMQRYRDSQGGRYPGTINTFGFGYSLDSELLSDMAIEGGGMYAFIPDSGFVGTAFVNALGNHLSSYGKQCVLSVETDSSSRIEEEGDVLGKPEHTVSSWGVAFKIPSLISGTSQDFVFTVRGAAGGPAPRLQVSLAYEHLTSSPSDRNTVHVESRTIDMPDENQFALSEDAASSPEAFFRSVWYDIHRLRLSLVDTLRTITEELKTAPDTPMPEHTGMVKSLVDDCDRTLRRIKDQGGPIARAHAREVKDVSARVSGLKDDLRGQVTEAISKPEWYKKWGKHYLLSLQRSHLLMQCNNFKDPGIQHYGGKLFQHYRDKADDVFMNLPPPTPSRAVYSAPVGGGGGMSTACTPAPRINMAAYNDMSGGCLHEASVVHMADGSRRPISALKKGDRVLASTRCADEQPQVAEVICMVRTECEGGAANLVTLDSGLRVTAWHPVRDSSGRWAFPASLCNDRPMQKIPCSYVYTFVLGQVSENSSSEFFPSFASGLVANGTECIALGHGIEDDDVASHKFLGTSLVIGALQKFPGWADGVVSLKQSSFVRNAMSGEIDNLTL